MASLTHNWKQELTYQIDGPNPAHVLFLYSPQARNRCYIYKVVKRPKKRKKKKKEEYVIDHMQAGKPKIVTVLPRSSQRKFADFLSKAENSHC